MIDQLLSLILQCGISLMVYSSTGIFNTSSFALGVNANARLIVMVGTDDRPVTKFDATMLYVNNGTLQQEFLTCHSFGLARVDANARPIVKAGTDDRPVTKFDATMF